jgi:hypothetical protein
MRRKSEAGQGRLGGLITLALIVAFGIAAWHVVPVFVAHYDFTDRVTEICRTPRYRGTDEDIEKLLLDETHKRELDQWIGADNFVISSSERGRSIKLEYEREVLVLPGWTHKFKFSYTADQPLL